LNVPRDQAEHLLAAAKGRLRTALRRK